MEGLIRKIIIGRDPKDAMAYYVGMNAGRGKVSAIVMDDKHLHVHGKKRYPGSTVQQNHGETDDKGFLLWDIRSADDFEAKFYEVENQYHFVTVDWQGDVQKTVNKCREYPNLSRFRIRADNYISQTDARRLQKILTKQKAASEVVFKVDSKFDSDKIETSKTGGMTIDLRSPDKHKELLREYYKSNNLNESDLFYLSVMHSLLI